MNEHVKKSERKAAIVMAEHARGAIISVLNMWLFRCPLSTANYLGLGGIWKAFDKLKFELLNLNLEADEEVANEEE